MKKNIKLTESKLISLIERIINEQSEESSISCDVNISKSPSSTSWNSMDNKMKSSKLKDIKSTISNAIRRSVQDYIEWFKNPLTIKKFKPNEKKVLNNIPNFLKGINKINLSFNPSNATKNARAWTSSNNLNLINYNIPQLHDGNNFLGASIYDTTKHEIGHLIDYYFKKNGIKTYLQTINTDSQESYMNNYIVNDNDQYTRLNVFRGIINAGPADSPITLLNKFLNEVKSNKITSNKFNFSGISSEKNMRQKNNTQTANQINKILSQSIYVNNKNSHNIEQLFSNFAINNGGTIYVSFDLIANLNLTSKEINRKYYYLKLTPK